MKSKSRSAKNITENIVFWGSIIVLILWSYWWRLRVLNVFPFDYDEGIHLILGKLWAMGYVPYQEIFVSYPPSFMWSLGIPWKIFNQASALQLMMSSYALSAVLAVVYLGTVYNSRLAGITAGVLLSFTPTYFIPSFSIMTEVPSISIAVAAIALAEKYRRDGGWGWVLLTGLGLGFGLSLKILPFYAVPFLGLLVISRHIEGSDIPNIIKNLKASQGILLRHVVILVGGFLITFLLPIFLFDFPAFYEQVVDMRLASTVAETNPFDSKNDDILDFLFRYPGLIIMATYGLVFVMARNLSRYWLLILWFILIWISLYFLTPLRGKHLPIFLPVIALFAGFAAHHIYSFLKQVGKEELSPRSVTMLLAIMVTLGIFGWNIPKVIAQNNGQALNVEENEERLIAIDFIDRISLPNDCLIADNPVFLYETNRLPPPQLAETSQTRIDTGYLTLQDIIGAIQRYDCHVVAVVTPRFGESIPGLKDWLAKNYLGLHAQSETYVYFAKKDVNQPDTPIENNNFGNIAQLYSFELGEQPWLRGKSCFISLYWQLLSPIEDDHIEHITLRNTDSGEQMYQLKRVPFEGRFNPAAWQVGERVRDTFRLDVPADLPSGPYDLFLSLCTPEMDRCLFINDQSQIELYLGQIIVQP